MMDAVPPIEISMAMDVLLLHTEMTRGFLMITMMVAMMMAIYTNARTTKRIEYRLKYVIEP